MISTIEIVRDIIKGEPLLEDGLAQGIINYSALARNLRPRLEAKLMKPVARGAIVMALKRVAKGLKQKTRAVEYMVNFNGLTVRSGLVELTYLNSDSIIEKYKKVFLTAETKKNVLCNLSQGVRETLLVVSEEIAPEVERIFSKERLVAKIKNLSSITIMLSSEAIETPGVYYAILKLLAWNDINFLDVISTFSELTIIFANKDIDRAFSIFKNYPSH